jgi:pilus assembly protein CpaC
MATMRRRLRWCGTLVLVFGGATALAEETGVVRLASAEQAVAQQRLKEKLAERDRLQREIATLCEATKTPEQVVVRVTVFEINRTAIRKLGIEFATALDREGNTLDAAVLGTRSQDAPAPPGALQFGIFEDAQTIRGFIDALEQRNVAKVLATPSVVTISGQPASVSVGGEVPIPNPGTVGDSKVQKYGTELNVKAVPLGDNRVRLNVRPRVSELDEIRGIVVEGRKIPAVTVRECDFSCDLEFGKSAVISGMAQERKIVTAGSWGRKREEVHEFALVIVATPEIAH